jgi:hypothetical protein
MSESVTAISQSVLTNTLTLTDTYQELFSYEVHNATIQISMEEDGTNIGSVLFLVSGGVVKNAAYTGGIDFSGSTDLSLLPLSYNASSHTMNYTLWFEYSNNKIMVSKNTQDPTLVIDFVGVFTSGTDTFTTNISKIDQIVENTTNAGITFNSKTHLNGGIVNIGTTSGGNHTVNIGTNSSSGGREINIGNTISGSALNLIGTIETPNPSEDTVTFNDTSAINWTDVSSTVKRVGKICHVVIKANLLALENLTKGTHYDMFSITPTNKYSVNYVVTGSCFESENNEIGCILSVNNSADFKILLPKNMATNDSTTIYGSVTYIAA